MFDPEQRQPLAIVVPAYKTEFLKQALISIENQTSKHFQVYIFDDNSPANIQNIAEPFAEKLGWKFHRFENNLGAKNLAAHWNRCIAQTREPWIWLFSDDDLMSENCVANWMNTINLHPESTVFKFPLQIINAENEVIEGNQPLSEQLTGFEFGKLRFNRQLFSSAVEFIFSRKAFERETGFVSFPSGWCSDDASWIAFTGSNPIQSINKGLISWRISEVNISSQRGDFTKIKLESSVQFMAWFNHRFQDQITPTFFAEQIIWLRLQMVHLDYQPAFWEVVNILNKLKIPFSSFWIRGFQDLYCLSFVYWKRVIKNENPHGFRYLLHLLLPKF